MQLDNSNTSSASWRVARTCFLVLWLIIYASQMVLYTSIAEIVIYSALGIVIAVGFLRWGPGIRSLSVLLGVIFVASITLGLVPYKIRVHDWALFFFQTAKEEGVTYYVDPYLNFSAMVWDAIFPVAHFVMMSAIAKSFAGNILPRSNADKR